MHLLGVYRLEGRGGAFEVVGVGHLGADDGVGADHGALAALDAGVGVPDGNFERQVAHERHVGFDAREDFGNREGAAFHFLDRRGGLIFGRGDERHFASHLQDFGDGVELVERFVVELFRVFVHGDEHAARDVPVVVVEFQLPKREVGEIGVEKLRHDVYSLRILCNPT